MQISFSCHIHRLSFRVFLLFNLSIMLISPRTFYLCEEEGSGWEKQLVSYVGESVDPVCRTWNRRGIVLLGDSIYSIGSTLTWLVTFFGLDSSRRGVNQASWSTWDFFFCMLVFVRLVTGGLSHLNLSSLFYPRKRSSPWDLLFENGGRYQKSCHPTFMVLCSFQLQREVMACWGWWL